MVVHRHSSTARRAWGSAEVRDSRQTVEGQWRPGLGACGGRDCWHRGFFLIPVVGIFVGFILGIYLAELARLQSVTDAWPTTIAAMKAAGISTLIDLATAVFATTVWVTGAVTLSLIA